VQAISRHQSLECPQVQFRVQGFFVLVAYSVDGDTDRTLIDMLWWAEGDLNHEGNSSEVGQSPLGLTDFWMLKAMKQPLHDRKIEVILLLEPYSGSDSLNLTSAN